MKRVPNKCYLCGSSEDITRDHIPPKCLFPSPLPSNLITVPCCYQCNHALHGQDELLRLFLNSCVGRTAQAMLPENVQPAEHLIEAT